MALTITKTESMNTLNLIISCEECGQVKHYIAPNEKSAERTFNNYRCPNNCDRSFYSYITIGQISLEDYTNSYRKASVESV